MIPLKLMLKNFVSFGSNIQTIDFEPYDFIALSGKNGHGKSALLEALTWAIWGQARKLGSETKADEGLLRLGQTHMMVCLDFICNKNQYRIKREYSKSINRSISNLEFAILDDETKKFRPLTDKTIKLTQKRIEKIVGISFDSFINSAFLRQGQSNEFSKKSPKERKEILANILQIDHYEQIRKLATDKIKNASNQKELYLQINQQIEEELKQLNTVILKLSQTNELLEKVHKELNELNLEKNFILEQKEKLLEQKAEFQKLNFEYEELNSHINKQTNEILEESKIWRKILKEQKQLKIDTQLPENLEEFSILSEKLNNLRRLSQERIKIKENLISKNQELQKYIQKFKDNYSEKLKTIRWSIETKKLNLKEWSNKLLENNNNYNICIKSINELSQNFKNLEVQEQMRQNLLTQLEKRITYNHKFNNKIDWISAHLNDLCQKNNIIKNTQNPTCPLCSQNLSDELKSSLKENLEKQIKLGNHQLSRLKKIKTKLDSLIKDQNEELRQLQTIEELQTNAKKFKENGEAFQNQINLTLEQIASDNQTLLNVENKFQEELEADSNHRVLLKELNIFEQMIKNNNYDPNLENEIIQKIEMINQKKDAQNKLIKEMLLQDQRQNKIKQLVKSTKELKKRKKIIEKELQKLSVFKAQEKEFHVKETEINQKAEILKLEKENLVFQKGGLGQKKIYLEQKKVEYQKSQEKIKILDQTIYEYKAVALALSKDGIQALLIENAIPEIEQEANDILSRLTDNQAHIIFDSLRDLKSGGTKETLDIKISDSAGIRSYELFSGGEAFRIDFALRIAISKLLAKKSGVALETLIIDEGFGSQDEEGLANIMQAIYKIKQDFAKIIIVSHLPIIKEQVPFNFVVNKGPQGSFVRVIEQG